MADKVKRKSRKILSKQDINLLVPVDITKLGSEDDPCFGKEFDPKAEECRRCGDCELCQIVISQKMHKKRNKVEKEGTYRDIEEEKIYNSQTPKEVRKEIRAIVRKLKKISKEDLIKQLEAKYPTLTNKRLNSILTRLIDKSDKLAIKNSQILWQA